MALSICRSLMKIGSDFESSAITPNAVIPSPAHVDGYALPGVPAKFRIRYSLNIGTVNAMSP